MVFVGVFVFVLTLPETEGNWCLDSTAPDCRLYILFFLIQNISAFIRFELSLILLQSLLHFININSPVSLFCLVVFMYHSLFCFPFLSCPKEMSSSAIKSESFSNEVLQPRDIGAIFFTTYHFCFPLCVPSPSLSNARAKLWVCLLPWRGL